MAEKQAERVSPRSVFDLWLACEEEGDRRKECRGDAKDSSLVRPRWELWRLLNSAFLTCFIGEEDIDMSRIVLLTRCEETQAQAQEADERWAEAAPSGRAGGSGATREVNPAVKLVTSESSRPWGGGEKSMPLADRTSIKRVCRSAERREGDRGKRKGRNESSAETLPLWQRRRRAPVNPLQVRAVAVSVERRPKVVCSGTCMGELAKPLYLVA